jgi:DNA-binding NtrC family response regulator
VNGFDPGELGREVREVAPETLDQLRGYGWPGNIRELQSVLKQALLQASGTTLLPAFLPELKGTTTDSRPTAPGTNPGLEAFIRERLRPESQDVYADTHRYVDRLLLALVLEYTRGSQHQAARMLGIARQTLRQKLRDLGKHGTHPSEEDATWLNLRAAIELTVRPCRRISLGCNHRLIVGSCHRASP